MAKRSALVALLDAESEPTQKHYNDIVDDVIRNPQLISGLSEGSVRDEMLILLTTRHHRLARFFHRLLSVARQTSKSSTASIITAESVDLLIDILPDLHQLLETTKLLEFLVPALNVCFISPQRPALCKLASVLVNSGFLLEHLVSDHLGVEVIRQWLSMQSSTALHAESLSLWTDRLVSMVHGCVIDHDTAIKTQQWHMLQDLKSSLQKIESDTLTASGKGYTSATRHDLPELGSMTQLNKEDKKSRLGCKEQKADTPNLDYNIKQSLRVFDISEPTSWAAIRSVIERLEREETAKLLLSLTIHFPCELCNQGLASSPRKMDATAIRPNVRTGSNVRMEILGKALGVWQILLSSPALRSLQEMSSQGLIKPVAEKLRALASGCGNTELFGDEAQRKRLKVPLYETSCGKNKAILWQLDIGNARDSQVLEQTIRVWEVGNPSEMAKVFDSVVLLQSSYSPETVRRCRQRPSFQTKKIFPARFEDLDPHSTKVSESTGSLDMKIVDQGTIDLANKFYALTEPIYDAIVANDLSAEFPFDLSREEARIISHFQSASLILGRSGTGKTTCLIFKMVGKYLASKAVTGETPVKQVLLTRSSFLADKLRAYAGGLIRTIDSKSISARSLVDGEQSALPTLQRGSDDENIFTLEDCSFPLVRTFDDFLRVLERTAEIFDRKKTIGPEVSRGHVFSEPEEIGKPRHWQQRKIINFRTFKLDYWPRLPRYVTKRLGVNLVFAEIMGVIKGSASSGQSLAPLSRQQYLRRSCRLAPVFVMEDDRSLVYDIFERYEQMKQEHQDVDDVDRVVRIISALRQNSSLKQLLESTIEEVYIDEVQDQRCVDFELLLGFIKDSRGLHFAGDTAQAISQDSTLRFADVKAIIYEHFAPASAYANQSQLAQTTMFTLAKNYRSHQGILALATFVMEMICKGFPETVDKLEPEVGNLNGPKPVIFLGCDASILRTSNVGLVNLSDRVAEFGAEQVILVRDEDMKAKLQGQIGDIALILTILDSKGMEFDDVILWDFFTSSPDPSGVRKLCALTREAQSGFDAQKHSAMCSELKHLYVAITRARLQLFLLESSEKAMMSIVDLLTMNIPEPLVDVTRPYESGFPEKLKLLRPGTSVDPVRWSLRGDELMQRENYVDAAKCYSKAKNHRGEAIANAKVYEEIGADYLTRNETQGFTQSIEAAINLYLKTNMIGDAAMNLGKLGRFGEAAELWQQHNETAKAAPLFAEAGLYVKAALCYRTLEKHSEAAAVLRRGSHFDQLVSHLDKFSEKMSLNSLKGYSLLCRLLLKQNKISPDFRSLAIKLLGSTDEQEACFIEYGMNEELAKLYAEQQRYQDLYQLFSKLGELEKALIIATTKGLQQSDCGPSETEISRILDYVWAGRVLSDSQESQAATPSLSTNSFTPYMRIRTEQWESTRITDGLQNFIPHHDLAVVENKVPETILYLRKILDATVITRTTSFDQLPFEMMQEAVKLAKDLLDNDPNSALRTLMILTGVWKSDLSKERFILLPWSPLHETLEHTNDVIISEVAKKWFLDRLVIAVLTMDSKARELWKLRWPTRCVQFLTVGFCPRQRRGEPCNWLHRVVIEHDTSQVAENLLRVNKIFCDLAVIYYRRALNETFQDNYLGIKRYWLERLLRELTYLSAVEQDASTIKTTQAKLSNEKEYIVIFSSLEELLYFRLVREWSKRSDFSSLVEQMQLAKEFGSNLQNRLFRAMSHRLFHDQRDLMQRHLVLLNMFEHDLSGQNALAFQRNLNIFLRNLENIDVQALSTLHALTAVFEYLATYLILETCDTACVLTQSYLNKCVPLFTDAIHVTEALSLFDRNEEYRKCLMELSKAFCRILSRFNQAPQPGITLLCSGKTHHPLLLRQRCAELVAIVVANLAPRRPKGLVELWTIANETFGYDFVRAHHFRGPTPYGITAKLGPSFLRYNGKDCLVVVIKHQTKDIKFPGLEHQPGVKSVSFDHVCPRTRTSAATPALADIPRSTSTGFSQQEYTTAETEGITKIQRLWRSCYRKIKDRRSYMQLPEARAVARFIALGAKCPATLDFVDRVALRGILISQGAATSLKLAEVRGTLSRLQEDAIACAEKVEISTQLFEYVDDILCRNRDVEALLGKAEEKMSEHYLVGLVKDGVPSMLEKTLKDIEDVILDIERDMLETRSMIDAVSCS